MVEDGKVTEGTSSNAYIVQGREGHHALDVEPHPAGRHAARPVQTRAANTASTIEERRFHADEAYGADEAFLTSSSNFVLPIVEIDGKRIGGGQPGPVTRKLREIVLVEAIALPFSAFRGDAHCRDVGPGIPLARHFSLHIREILLHAGICSAPQASEKLRLIVNNC